MDIELIVRKATFFKSLYHKVQIINSCFKSGSYKKEYLSEKGWLEGMDTWFDIPNIVTYIDIDDCWFVFVLEKLSLKIYTINLPRC